MSDAVTVHTVPVDDLIEHCTDGKETCACGPEHLLVETRSLQRRR